MISISVKYRMALLLFSGFICILTLYPFEFSMEHYRFFRSMAQQDMIRELLHFQARDIIGNLLLFMPLGFLMRQSGLFRRRTHGVMCAILAGGLFSLGVETGQLFLRRSTNFIDIMMNGLGTGLGYGITRYLTAHVFSDTRIRRMRSAMIAVYVIFLAGIMSYPAFENRVRWWKAWYPLVLGNEGDALRPWRGEIYKIGIYQHAVTPEEAERLYQTRSLTDAAYRRNLGAVAFYPLLEGAGDTLQDYSDYEEPVPLVATGAHWLPMGGLRCDGGLIRSPHGADKIVRAIDSTQQFSIEAWVKPDNLTQVGPARIVTLSPDVTRRNMTLAQEGRQIRLRVRSRFGGWNGSNVNLVVPAVLDSPAPVHLIATFNRGTQQLFVNGRRNRSVLFTHFDYLPLIAGFGHRDIAKWIFFFVMLLPLSLLLNSRFPSHVFQSVLFSVVLILGIDMALAVGLKQPVCLQLHAVSLIASLCGGILMIWFKENPR